MRILDTQSGKEASSGENIEEFVEQFYRQWREEGRQELERKLQERIHKLEAEEHGAMQIRSKQFQTPLGTIVLQRRFYEQGGERICWADRLLGLPADGWFSPVEELAAALGLNSEFANAQRLFSHWTGIVISDHGLANRIEAVGVELEQYEDRQETVETAGMASALARQVQGTKPKSRIYVGADGILIPLNHQQGYKEVRVGVVFGENERWRLSEKRTWIRYKEYVATLRGSEIFAEKLYKQYAQVVQQRQCETIVLGDGAGWIWSMASQYYPESVQILDFFHVSEYVWEVARAAWTGHELKQQRWVKEQLERLKESQWQQVIEELKGLPNPSQELEEACTNLERYLRNNACRIDYRTYLAKGYMIGSGVVESSNRKVVAQRLKQAGMHWSQAGAQAVISLRACYCSSGERWQEFWRSRVTDHSIRHKNASERQAA